MMQKSVKIPKTVFGDVPELTAGDVEPEGTNSTIADTMRIVIEGSEAIDMCGRNRQAGLLV